MESNEIKPVVEKEHRKQNLMAILGSYIEDFREFIDDLLDIESDADREGTIEYIKNNKRIQGGNAWLLIASIFLASIGLDQNSTAVIIGAMLVSPLMSPILGIGLAVGINDKETLIVSAKNFLYAIIIALLTSYIYFALTPFGEVTKEISSRTSPTLLDALVAVFGGIAGIVSSSRIEKSNAIPGVAIATALMPPLCVAGYGLADGNWEFFLNAFYLFFLNSFFIALTTFLVVRFLRFPYAQYVSVDEKRKTQMMIWLLSIVMLVPSGFILNKVLQEAREQSTITKFAEEYFGADDKWQYLESYYEDYDSLQVLTYTIQGEPMSNETHDFYMEKAKDFGITCEEIHFIPTQAVSKNSFENIQAAFTNLQGEMQRLTQEQTQSNTQIDKMAKKLATFETDSIDNAKDYKQIKGFIPELGQISFNSGEIVKRSDTTLVVPLVIVGWEKPIKRQRDLKRYKSAISNYYKVEYNLDTISIAEY